VAQKYLFVAIKKIADGRFVVLNGAFLRSTNG
jgi:hypothetical protein